jgi:hypothetical protein
MTHPVDPSQKIFSVLAVSWRRFGAGKAKGGALKEFSGRRSACWRRFGVGLEENSGGWIENICGVGGGMQFARAQVVALVLRAEFRTKRGLMRPKFFRTVLAELAELAEVWRRFGGGMHPNRFFARLLS